MKSNKVMVSVCCMAYNHEHYIRRCLDGFVMQKTNFKYEVLIHDDASTDRTADIIREYEKEYPDIIKPIYQTENQYSKGVAISREFQYPRAKGKYIALCEGDDYWTDENKLQKQVDFLENNPEYSICVHQVSKHNCITKVDSNFIDQFENKIYSLEEVVIAKDVFFGTSSIVMRETVPKTMPECFRSKGFGDYQLFMYAAIVGKFYYMSDNMSVYNYQTPGSWTSKYNYSPKFRIDHTKALIRMLQRINEYYDYKYNEIFSKAIENVEYQLCIFTGNIFKIHKLKFRRCYLDDIDKGLSPNKLCIINKFPKLYSVYSKLKGWLVNGKK